MTTTTTVSAAAASLSKMLRISPYELHLPSMLIGSALPTQSKVMYDRLIRKMDIYINEQPPRNESLLPIIDYIDEIYSYDNYDIIIPVYSEAIYYLRIQILSTDAAKAYNSIIVADTLVKNSGYKIHVLIGQRKFMKTMGIIARKYINDVMLAKRQVSMLALDCIQAWGEAFYPRERYYPEIYHTYYNMRHKYQIPFPCPDFDPTRVPIFLGLITKQELYLVHAVNQQMHKYSSNDDVEYYDEEEEEELKYDSLPNAQQHHPSPTLDQDHHTTTQPIAMVARQQLIVIDEKSKNLNDNSNDRKKENNTNYEKNLIDFDYQTDKVDLIDLSDNNNINNNNINTSNEAIKLPHYIPPPLLPPPLSSYPIHSSFPSRIVYPTIYSRQYQQQQTNYPETASSSASSSSSSSSSSQQSSAQVPIPQSGISAWDQGIIYGSDMKLKTTRTTVGTVIDRQHVKTTPAAQNVSSLSSQSNTKAVTDKVTTVLTPLTEEVVLGSLSTMPISNDKSLSIHQRNDRNMPVDDAKEDGHNEKDDEEYYPTSSADNEGEYIPEVKTRQPKYSPYLPPSSDPSVEIKYYGHQRVVIKKT